jgi:misacylated tRNA(Ala) deacylase
VILKPPPGLLAALFREQRAIAGITMTELLYLDDSYLTAFDAIVQSTTDDGIVLDRTAFYATGGGQPHDVGTLIANGTGYTVTSVVKRDGAVLHTLDLTNGLPEPGATVHGEIDWERRYRLMRTHSALHVLCGVVFREFGALVTGGNMGLDKARMDFELEDLSAERVSHIERVANAVIQSGRTISWRTLPREEAFQIPDLIRTKINLLPASISQVRIVEVEGLDIQADGGTHVRNTREIGGIRVISTRSKGRINKRLEIELVDSDRPQEGR